jgi:hypothetical protein
MALTGSVLIGGSAGGAPVRPLTLGDDRLEDDKLGDDKLGASRV